MAAASLVGARFASLERLLAVSLEHEIGGAPDIDLGFHAAKLHSCGLQEFNTTDCIACKDACQGGHKMARVLTAENFVRRIVAECVFVDERGGVAFGWSLLPRSCGSTASSSVGWLGPGKERPNRRRCCEGPSPLLLGPTKVVIGHYFRGRETAGGRDIDAGPKRDQGVSSVQRPWEGGRHRRRNFRPRGICHSICVWLTKVLGCSDRRASITT